MKKVISIFVLFYVNFLYAAEVQKLVETNKTWDGTKIKKIKIKEPKVTVLHITIKKGEQLPLHKHPVLNVGYLLKGQLTVYKEGNKEKLILNEGESLVELIDQWHYGKNTGKTDAVIVVFYIGDKKDKITIKK